VAIKATNLVFYNLKQLKMLQIY